MKHAYIIAIDPDVDKSGVALVCPVSGSLLQLKSLEFPFLLDYLKEQAQISVRSHDNVSINNQLYTGMIVVVEAGWLNQSNWHIKRGDNTRLASAKGNSTGRNHEVGRKIVEMCKHYGLEVIEQRPLRKCWKGKDGKITHEELSQFIPFPPKRTNQEERDAALLAWHYAGLPIRVKV